MNSPLLAALSDRVLIYDGAMGTQIQAAGFSDEDFILREKPEFSSQSNETAQRLGGKLLDGCNEILNLTRPEAIKQIHKNYFAAGADLIETNTFGCSTIVLAEYEIPELNWDISLAAGKIAVEAAREASTPDRPRFAIGASGPGTKLVTLGQCNFEELRTS